MNTPLRLELPRIVSATQKINPNRVGGLAYAALGGKSEAAGRGHFSGAGVARVALMGEFRARLRHGSWPQNALPVHVVLFGPSENCGCEAGYRKPVRKRRCGR